MNDIQRGFLVATPKHVDELLGETRRILLATIAPCAFTWYVSVVLSFRTKWSNSDVPAAFSVGVLPPLSVPRADTLMPLRSAGMLLSNRASNGSASEPE